MLKLVKLDKHDSFLEKDIKKLKGFQSNECLKLRRRNLRLSHSTSEKVIGRMIFKNNLPFLRIQGKGKGKSQIDYCGGYKATSHPTIVTKYRSSSWKAFIAPLLNPASVLEKQRADMFVKQIVADMSTNNLAVIF